MKTYAIIFCLLIFVSFIPKKSSIEMRIINKEIKNGTNVSVEIINNTNKDYLFLMDTTYYKKSSVLNPFFLISESNGKFSSFIHDVNICEKIFEVNYKKNPYFKLNSTKDTLLVEEEVLGNVENLTKIIKIKSNKSFKFKIPFNLTVKYNLSEELMYYKTDKSKKYLITVNYFASRININKMFSKEALDSIKKNNMMFFSGSLSSNKVPLILK